MKKSFTTAFILLISNFIFAQSIKNQIEENRFLEMKENKFGVTDSLNNEIIPFKYNFIEYENKRLIVKYKNLNGVFSINNVELIPIKYKFILPRKKDRFILWSNNSLFGLSDLDGNIILPVKYKNVSSTINDDFYITKSIENLNAVFDYNGKLIFDEAYKFYTIDNYKIFATKNNQPQILDIQNPNNTVSLDTSIKFIETARHYTSGEKLYQIIKKNNKYGIINANNEIIIPVKYDEIKSSQNWKYFLIKQSNKIGLININGTIIKNPIYDKVEFRKEYLILKRKNAKDEFYTYQN